MKKYLLCFLIIGLFAHKSYSQKETPPMGLKQATTVTKAKQAELTVNTIDAFILWASGSSKKEREVVRTQIVNAKSKGKISDGLFERFYKVEQKDFSKAVIILAIIGELRTPEAIEPLYKIATATVPPRSADAHNQLEETDRVEMLATKAVEGLAYFNTPNTDELVRKIIATHPSRTVRATAINAYLYNKRDSKEAKEQLRGIIQKGDENRLDATRLIANQKSANFNQKAAEFYSKYPEHNAKLPTIGKENSIQDKELPKPLTPPVKPKN